ANRYAVLLEPLLRLLVGDRQELLVQFFLRRIIAHGATPRWRKATRPIDSTASSPRKRGFLLPAGSAVQRNGDSRFRGNDPVPLNPGQARSSTSSPPIRHGVHRRDDFVD